MPGGKRRGGRRSPAAALISAKLCSSKNVKQFERTMNAGPGKPSGGGAGGRRRRRGRRPSNQRGQRPGPGLSRENKDGIYTAPMDHSYRAARNDGDKRQLRGRQRAGFADQCAAA